MSDAIDKAIETSTQRVLREGPTVAEVAATMDQEITVAALAGLTRDDKKKILIAVPDDFTAADLQAIMEILVQLCQAFEARRAEMAKPALVIPDHRLIVPGRGH